jgi:hypothetical protein
MGLGDPLLRGHAGEERAGPLLVAAYPLNAIGSFSRGWVGCSAAPSCDSGDGPAGRERAPKVQNQNNGPDFPGRSFKRWEPNQEGVDKVR